MSSLVSSNLKQDIGYPNNDSYDRRNKRLNSASRVPVPHANSNMQFNGVCRDITAAGILRIKVLSTALNVPPNSSAPSDSIAQPSRESSSAPVTPMKRRKSSPSPPSSVAADPPVTPTSVAATSHSPTPFPFNMAPSGPMLYGHPFQQCPQHVSSASAPFMAPFPHSLPYSLPAQHIFPRPGFTTHSHYNSWGEYINPVDPLLQTAPETGSSLAPSDRPSDDDSAFNKSAANPYSYPMTQTPSAPAKSANDNSPMSVANEGFFGSQPASQQSTSRAQPLSL
ncbi:hypothetical protein K438DRAFT_2149969 [Mycena galopus ATCC 62051]|nr:hypothetical protein K438DRAFT_2149969 [Mycena galopus ATCC 62051]